MRELGRNKDQPLDQGCFPRGHLATSGDTLTALTGNQTVESRDAVKHPKVCGTALPPTKNYLGHDLESVTVGKARGGPFSTRHAALGESG